MSFLSQFYYRITGQPEFPKLVFLHGLMGFSSNWQRIIKAFEDRYQILVYDQRGHGRSFKPDFGYSPEDYAQDLKSILDELKWEKINLVGHSMGGRNALSFAFQYPEKVEKLVIEDISPEFSKEAIDRLRSLIHAVPAPFANRDLARNFFEHDFPVVMKARPDALALGQFLYSNLQSEADGKMVWRFSKKGILDSLEAGRARNRWREWETLNVPTLLVRGEKSKDLSPETYKEMLARQTHAKGVEIADSGHWIHFDKPDEFIEVLKNFLN